MVYSSPVPGSHAPLRKPKFIGASRCSTRIPPASRHGRSLLSSENGQGFGNLALQRRVRIVRVAQLAQTLVERRPTLQRRRHAARAPTRRRARRADNGRPIAPAPRWFAMESLAPCRRGRSALRRGRFRNRSVKTCRAACARNRRRRSACARATAARCDRHDRAPRTAPKADTDSVCRRVCYSRSPRLPNGKTAVREAARTESPR